MLHGLVWCATQVVVSAMGVATVAARLAPAVTCLRVVVYPNVEMDGMGTRLLEHVRGVTVAVGHAVVETPRIAALVTDRTWLQAVPASPRVKMVLSRMTFQLHV